MVVNLLGGTVDTQRASGASTVEGIESLSSLGDEEPSSVTVLQTLLRSTGTVAVSSTFPSRNGRSHRERERSLKSRRAKHLSKRARRVRGPRQAGPVGAYFFGSAFALGRLRFSRVTLPSASPSKGLRFAALSCSSRSSRCCFKTCASSAATLA